MSFQCALNNSPLGLAHVRQVSMSHLKEDRNSEGFKERIGFHCKSAVSLF